MPRHYIKKGDGPKRGRLSKEEEGFIRGKAPFMSAEAIAKKLGRPVGQIQKEYDKYMGMTPEKRLTLQQQLELRPEWRQFEKQFTFDELNEFKHQYVQIVSTQFKDDLLPTEELQLFQVITLKILIDRTLAEQKMALEDMQSAHQALEGLEERGTKTQSVKDQISLYETKYENAKKTNRECADRYKIYSDKQDKMFAALKGTRDQRVKFFENSKHSVLGWLRLLMDEENRREMGDEAEFMRRAAEKERERLSRIYTYEDGFEDRPLLTPEIVLQEEEDE